MNATTDCNVFVLSLIKYMVISSCFKYALTYVTRCKALLTAMREKRKIKNIGLEFFLGAIEYVPDSRLAFLFLFSFYKFMNKGSLG